MKNLKRLSVILLLFLSASLLFSQSLPDPGSMSEEEIWQELELIINSLETDNESLKKSNSEKDSELSAKENELTQREADSKEKDRLLSEQDETLAEQETLLQNYAKEKAQELTRAVILTAVISGAVCGVAGLLFGLSQ
jgi:uncharacterized protein (DUF3084 family)